MVVVSFKEMTGLEQIITNPLTVSSTASVKEVILQMRAARVSSSLEKDVDTHSNLLLSDARSSCVLVREKSQLLGIFTESDVVRLSVNGINFQKTTIADVITKPVITLKSSEFTDIFIVLILLQRYQIRHLPIVDDNDQVIGLITDTNLCKIRLPEGLLRSRLVSEVMNKNLLCATAETSVLELCQLMTEKGDHTVVIVAANDNTRPLGIVTARDIVQCYGSGVSWEKITALEVISSPLLTLTAKDSLWTAQSLIQEQNLHQLLVTDDNGILLGIVTTTSLLQTLKPGQLHNYLETLEEKVFSLEKEKVDILENCHWQLEQTVSKRTTELTNQLEKEKLLTSIAGRIRSSLDLRQTLNTIVEEVRQFLQCDRVFIYEFNPDWSGVIVAESIMDQHESFLNQMIHDPCFTPNWLEPYVNGNIRVVPDIYQAGLSPCHIELLEQIQTRAKILVPIVQNGQLWGLLSATEKDHPRNWQKSEVTLLQQLSTQIAIAIQQADIHRQLQLELAERKRTEEALRQSEKRYATLAAAVPVGIFRTDAQGNCIYINERWCQMTGNSFDQAMGKGWIKAIHPEDRRKVLQEWHTATTTQQPFRLEYRFQRPDSKISWVFCQAVAEQGENEEIVGYVGTITDISERKQAEITLQEREELLSSIAENIADGYAYRSVIHPDGTIEIPYISTSATKLLGNFNSSLSWQEIYSRILPEDRKLFQQVMQKAIQSLGRLDNEYRIRDVSGRIRWINSRGQVSPLENGSVIIEGVALDITERRQAQADLQALVEGAAAVTGKDLFSLLLEYIASFLNVRCALIVTRNGAHFQTAAFWADGKLQNNVSGLLEKMPCYLTMTQGKFCCPQKLFQDFPDPLFSELDSYVGVAIKSTAGETLGSLCLLDNKPIVDVDRMTAILQVFAARVGAELERQQAMTALEQLNQELEIGVEERTFELRESQERWELALRGTNDGIWDWNLRTNEVFYSSRWKQMRGFADDEIGSRIQEWSNLIHDDDYNRVMNALADHLARKTPFFQEEYRVQRKDGSCMWVLDRRQALWDENGHVLRVVGSESDITIRKQTEQELRKINEQLTLTNAELQRATRLKDEFLANMSHELRTPLNAILGLSEGLQEDVFGEINPGQQKAIATIERSGRHLLELINDILDLSKIESGKLELQLALVPIKNLVDSTLPFVRQQATQKNINFSVYLPHSLGKIFVDELRIRQVLINLLNNAIKFTHEGGNVSLFLNLDGNDLVISVTDTGIGIAPEDMNKLFQPFVQLDTKLSRQYNGTGLGLSLVRRLVDLHHGTVEVTSELGKGSCFTVKLPHHQSGNDDLIRHVAFPSWNLSNLSPENNKVLIIEDTRTAAEQVQRYLDEIGMEAVVYPQGEGAIAQIISYQPALIILDIMLPHRSGWEVLAQIKAHPETCSIPVIIVSVVDERSHGLELGATEYLVKPINRQQFHQVIHQLRQPTTNLTLESQNTPEIDAPSQITQKSPLILIAEDNEANVDTISNYLESRGYRLLVAKNGVESIELTKNHHPDLILIDIQMPIMDGLEATRLIRTDQNLTNIPIIALTGLAMPGDRDKCLQAGANEYLTKPVRLKQLTTMIENLLYESRNNPQC